MSSRSIIIGYLFAVGLLIAGLSQPAHATFAQALEGGCYLAEENQCRIHVSPFEIQVNESSGERVAEFILTANNVSGGLSFQVWRYHTSNSYGFKPIGDYTPMLPAQDFPAVCGETYNLNILTRGDTSTVVGSFGNAGRTGDIECPAPMAP